MASSCKRRICTNEKLGFREDLDTWRAKLIVCVGAEKILELLETKIVDDVTQFKDYKPASVSNWSFDENCLFCCLRREKVKEHVIALNNRIVESGGKPLLGKDHGNISRLEWQVEEFINAAWHRKEYAPRIPDPHIPVVACDTMQQMINHLVVYATSNSSQDSPQHNGTDPSLLKTHSSPSPITVATPIAAALTQNPVLGKLLMEDQDGPLDLSVKKVRKERKEQDGVLDLSLKRNCNSDNISLGSPDVNLTTATISRQTNLQPVSTLEQFMTKLCLHHQRQIVDAFGFLQSEMKSVTSTSEVQVSTPSALDSLPPSKTMNSDHAEERSEIQHTEENLPAARDENTGQESPNSKNEVSPLEQPLENDGPLIASSKNGSFTHLGQADIGYNDDNNDDDKGIVEGSSTNIQRKCPALLMLKNNLGNLESKMSEMVPISHQTLIATLEQDKCTSDRQAHTNSIDDTVGLPPHVCLPAQSNASSFKPCSIQRTPNAISLNSRTAKKSSRGPQSRLGFMGNPLKDPDIKYDIVYVGKPITECELQTRNHMLPRKNARKSTRGHLSFGDCWEIKTVRTLARKSAQNCSGNYPVPMPDIMTSIAPNQALAKPDGLPAMKVPFTGDCMETVINKNLSDQSVGTQIPGDVVELSEHLIVEPSQTGQTQEKEQIPCLVSGKGCDLLEQEDSNLDVHDLTDSTEISEKIEFTKKDTMDVPALSGVLGGLETEVHSPNLAAETMLNTDFTCIGNDASGAEIERSLSDMMFPQQTKDDQVTCTNNGTILQKTCGTEANLKAVDYVHLDKDKLESKISAFVVEEINTEDQLDKHRDCVSESLSSKKDASKHALPSDRCLRSGVSKGISEQTNVTNISDQIELADLDIHEKNFPDTKQSLMSSKLKHTEENVSCQEGQYNVDVADAEKAQHSPVVKQIDSMGNKVSTRQKQKLLMVNEIETDKNDDTQEVPILSKGLEGQGCEVNTAAENEINSPQQCVKSRAKNSPGKSLIISERMPLRNRNSQSEHSDSTANSSSLCKSVIHTPERMPLRSKNSFSVDQPVDGNSCSSPTAVRLEELEEMPLRDRNSGLVEQMVSKDSSIFPNKSSLDSVAHMPLRSRNCSAVTVKFNEGSSDEIKDTSGTITDKPSGEESVVTSKKLTNIGHMPLRSGSGLVTEHSSSYSSFGSDAGTVSESPGRMSLRRGNTLSADKLNSLPTLSQSKNISQRLQKMSRNSELSLVQKGEHNNNSFKVKTEKSFNDQMKVSLIPDPFNSFTLPATGPLIPSPCKFLEALNGEANQHLISDLNSKFEKMQKGWVQMDKEGQPAPKPKNKADRLKEIWKSKRRIRKPRSLEQQKFSPVQMLFMKSFDLPNICRWFLQSTETKSLVIVKKVNTRLPSETQLRFQTSPSLPESCDGAFPSLQAERLKKHLKKFAIASPVKSNPKNKRLIAKALSEGLTKAREKQEPRTATRISSKPQSCSGLTQTQSFENHSKVAASTKNPASARILRKYSNMREKKQVQQNSLKNFKRSLVEVDNSYSTTKDSRERLSTRREQKSAIVQKVTKKAKTPAAKKKIPQAGGRGLRYLNKKHIPQRRVLPRFLKSNRTVKPTSEKETHLKPEMSPRLKTDIKKSPSQKGPESLMSQSQIIDIKPFLSEDQVLTRSQRKMEATLAQTGSPRASTKRVMETSVTPAKRMRTSK